MANKAAEFLNKVLSDETLKARLAGKAPAQAAELAAELGYEVTEEELMAAEKELRKQDKADVAEIDLEDMDKAAGGSLWEGEDASDGHEMGCNLIYHGIDYSSEHNEWCTNNYYHKGKPKQKCARLYY